MISGVIGKKDLIKWQNDWWIVEKVFGDSDMAFVEMFSIVGKRTVAYAQLREEATILVENKDLNIIDALRNFYSGATKERFIWKK